MLFADPTSCTAGRLSSSKIACVVVEVLVKMLCPVPHEPLLVLALPAPTFATLHSLCDCEIPVLHLLLWLYQERIITGFIPYQSSIVTS